MTTLDRIQATPASFLVCPAGSTPQRGVPAVLKRTLDVVVSAVLLVVLAPVFAVIAAAVRLDTSGPAFFSQTRVGRDGRPITVHKFRSMVDGAESDAHRRYVLALLRGEEPPADAQVYKVNDDARVTRVGRALRRTSLDELPQLLDVLRGDMSLVGPRPDVPYALEAYEPRHFERFVVLPGMTGLWQVSGRSALSPRDMLELDVRYVRQWSLRGDMRILWRTAITLVHGGVAA